MKKKNFAVLLNFLILSGLMMTNSYAAVDYSSWDKVLKTYVNERGLVSYAALKEDTEDLDGFIRLVQDTDVNTLSPEEKKAFWINAYNALTLWVVRNKYPVGSIRYIDFGLVWKKGRLVAGDKYRLGHIEHKILRPLGDPRVHFVLNCASIGCPYLPREPFYPERLEEQLEQQAENFINNPDKVRLDRSSGTLYHSAIFDWFEEDFLKTTPDILTYIKKYINEQDRTYLENNEVRMKVLNYDWGLNEQK